MSFSVNFDFQPTYMPLGQAVSTVQKPTTSPETEQTDLSNPKNSSSPQKPQQKDPELNLNLTGANVLDSIPKKDKPDKSVSNTELSEQEKEVVDNLKKRDMEVKAHEQAHVAAGGAYVKGGISYTFETGPDGNRYAVGGEVQIDSSPVKGDPQATIIKAQIIKGAALAPANPSGQDRAVAAKADQMMQKARQELMQKPNEENESIDIVV